MTDLSFVPGVALGLTLGIGGTWMAMRACRALAITDRDTAIRFAAKYLVELNDEKAFATAVTGDWREAHSAHSRCSDALNVCQSKLSDVRDLLSQPETIRKGDLRRILGEGQ